MVCPTKSDEHFGSCSEVAAVVMLRERNLFVLQARRGPTERVQTLTLLVHVREQDLSHFNGRSGTAGAQRIAVSYDRRADLCMMTLDTSD